MCECLYYIRRDTPGRFSLLVGIMSSMDDAGAAFSNLVASYIAQTYGFQVAYTFLGILAFSPAVLFAVKTRNLFTAVEETETFIAVRDTRRSSGLAPNVVFAEIRKSIMETDELRLTTGHAKHMDQEMT
jgi:hypothetical protein